MKVKFLGYAEQGKTGCVPCGNRRVSGQIFKREKRMVLPSGRAVSFYAGQVYDVDEEECTFLLEMNEKGKRMFEKAD